ncbi:hypothetical protein [Paenibacillus sp. Leaf72]|uniref:hypothetical protein n=1 Tax=Paenibacillus sp. Leaf72 TaxID=1736234 RepID=UPI000A6B57A3|nr:hypothetical protein [Paenibacillus sp. Leaf72]
MIDKGTSGTYYTGYLAAAKRLGITTGVGDNQLAGSPNYAAGAVYAAVPLA